MKKLKLIIIALMIFACLCDTFPEFDPAVINQITLKANEALSIPLITTSEIKLTNRIFLFFQPFEKPITIQIGDDSGVNVYYEKTEISGVTELWVIPVLEIPSPQPSSLKITFTCTDDIVFDIQLVNAETLIRDLKPGSNTAMMFPIGKLEFAVTKSDVNQYFAFAVSFVGEHSNLKAKITGTPEVTKDTLLPCYDGFITNSQKIYCKSDYDTKMKYKVEITDLPATESTSYAVTIDLSQANLIFNDFKNPHPLRVAKNTEVYLKYSNEVLAAQDFFFNFTENTLNTGLGVCVFKSSKLTSNPSGTFTSCDFEAVFNAETEKHIAIQRDSLEAYFLIFNYSNNAEEYSEEVSIVNELDRVIDLVPEEEYLASTLYSQKTFKFKSEKLVDKALIFEINPTNGYGLTIKITGDEKIYYDQLVASTLQKLTIQSEFSGVFDILIVVTTEGTELPAFSIKSSIQENQEFEVVKALEEKQLDIAIKQEFYFNYLFVDDPDVESVFTLYAKKPFGSAVIVAYNSSNITDSNGDFINATWQISEEERKYNNITVTIKNGSELYLIIKNIPEENTIKMIFNQEYSKLEEGEVVSIIGEADTVEYFEIKKKEGKNFRLDFALKDKRIQYTLTKGFDPIQNGEITKNLSIIKTEYAALAADYQLKIELKEAIAADELRIKFDDFFFAELTDAVSQTVSLEENHESAFYYKIDNTNEEVGALSLIFEEKNIMAKENFIIQLKEMDIADEKYLEQIPKKGEASDFEISSKEDSYHKVFYRRKNPPAEGKKLILFILFNMEKPAGINVKITLSKVPVVIDLQTDRKKTMNPELQSYIPYYYRFKRMLLDSTVFFSNYPVTLYHDGLFTEPKSKHVQVNYFSFENTSLSFEYIVEYYTEITALKPFLKYDSLASTIRSSYLAWDDPEAFVPCTTPGNISYYSVTFTNYDKRVNRIQYVRSDWGEMRIDSNFFSDFTENQDIFPTESVPIKPVGTIERFGLMKVTCYYPGIYTLGYTTLLDSIAIKDDIETARHYLNDKNEHTITFSNLKDPSRNIEIRLVNETETEDKSLSFKIKGEPHILNKANRVLWIENFSEDTITVTSEFTEVAFEIKIGMPSTMKEVKTGEDINNQKHIYFVMTNPRASAYKFQFNQDFTGEYTFYTGISKNGFIPRPITPLSVFILGNSFSTHGNPVGTLGALSNDEFYFTSLQVPDKYLSTYKLTITPEGEQPNILPGASLVENTLALYYLETNKTKQNTTLSIYTSQCSVGSYSLELLFQSTRQYQKTGETLTVHYFEFENKYLPYDLKITFTETPIKATNPSLWFSYNYMTKDDSSKIKADIEANLGAVRFDGTSIVSWDKLSAEKVKYSFVFTLDVGETFENECLLKTTKSKIDIPDGDSSLDLSTTFLNSGNMKINIIAIIDDKIQYMKTYKAIQIQYTSPKVKQIKNVEEGYPFSLENSKDFSFFIDMTSYSNTEEGVVTLFLDGDSDSKSIQIFSALNEAKATDPKDPFIPNTPLFKPLLNNNNIKMYYKNSKPQDLAADKVFFLIIHIVFPGSYTYPKASISTSRVTDELSIQVDSPVRKSFKIQQNIPHFVKVSKNAANMLKGTIFYSDSMALSFSSSLLDENLNLKNSENWRMEVLTKEQSEMTYILEFSGKEGTATFQIESKLDNTSKIKPNEANDYDCTEDQLGKPAYQLIEMLEYSNSYLVEMQRWGKFEFNFKHITFEGTNNSILPSKDNPLNGFKQITAPYFSLEYICRYVGSTKLYITKALPNPEINPDKNNVFLLEKKSFDMPLTHVKDRKFIRVELSQALSSTRANEEVKITIGSNPVSILTTSNPVDLLPIPNTEGEVTMRVENSYQQTLINFELAPKTQFVEVKEGKTDQKTNWNIFFKLTDDRAKEYKITFNSELTITPEFKYSITKGRQEVLVDPQTPVIKEGTAQSITVANLLNTYGGLAKDEAYYYTLSIPPSLSAYDITIEKIMDPTGLTLIDVEKIGQFEKLKSSLKGSKDLTKPNLMVYLAQCKVENTSVKLNHKGELKYSLESKNAKQLLDFNNDFVPFDLELAGTTEPAKYVLSYNYLTNADKTTLTSLFNKNYAITKGESNTIAWDTENAFSSYRLFIKAETDSEPIPENECLLHNATEATYISLTTKTFNFSEKNYANGIYNVKVLGYIKTPLEVAIAFTTFKMTVSGGVNPTPEGNGVWVWVGVALGIVAVIVIGVVVFYFRRQKKLEIAEMQFSQLISQPHLENQLETK